MTRRLMKWWTRDIAWRLLPTKAHEWNYVTRADLNNRTKRHHDKQRAIAIANGDCQVCWKRPKDDGYSTCTECRAYNREYRAKQRRERGVPKRNMAPAE